MAWYIGDNSELILEPTELMRRTSDAKARVANSVHACRTARGSIAPHVRCIDPGWLLRFSIKVTSAEFSHSECYGRASSVALVPLSLGNSETPAVARPVSTTLAVRSGSRCCS